MADETVTQPSDSATATYKAALSGDAAAAPHALVLPLDVIRSLSSSITRPDVQEFLRANGQQDGNYLVQLTSDTVQFV